MTESPQKDAPDEISRAVELREQRRKEWQEHGERSLWQNLSWIGALGWLIVTPTLLGVLLGRWIDRWLDSGITFSAAMIMLGLTLGCYMAWKSMNPESDK